MYRTIKRITLLLAVSGLVSLLRTSPAFATSFNVTSTADSGPGSLRQAILDANSAPGADTINFSIGGSPDFTNNGQNGYTIKPTSGLPDITDTVTIDGYSQPGAQANTAVAPNPLNGVLLVEVNGTNVGTNNAFQFTDNSDNSTIKGLVINDFSQSDAVEVLADGIKVQGNYIGTDPTGFTAHPNVVGVNALVTDPLISGHDALIGGLTPADRNLISGNTAGTTGTAGYPGTGWVIQGNYVGVAADGLTPVANSTPGGSGAFSIDDNQDVTVGGSQPGAINVIGESQGHGLAPDHTANLLIEGNYIGLGYDGTTVLGNSHASDEQGSGMTLSNVTNATIKDNKIAGFSNAGVDINQANVNISMTGNEVHDNSVNGISVGFDSSKILVTNSDIYNNLAANIYISGYPGFTGAPDDIKIQGNKIGLLENGQPATRNGVGVLVSGSPTNLIIGGSGGGQGNVISASKGTGVVVSSLIILTYGASFNPNKVTILGNSFYSNPVAANGPFTTGGLGIDLLEGTDTDTQPDGVPNTYTNVGPTINDSSDSDTGPNNYINFPVLNSVSQNGNKADINFNLYAADSPTNQYRVEFFANDVADPSGYGEGQTFLGAVTVANGDNQQASLTLPTGTNLTGKSISATTTAVDSTTDSGFGSTSEFSKVVVAASSNTVSPSAVSTDPKPTSLASSGNNIVTSVVLAGIFALSVTVGARFITTKRNVFQATTRNR